MRSVGGERSIAAAGDLSGEQVNFQWKNPDFLLKNLDFLCRNPDFLLENVDFIIKQMERLSGLGRGLHATALYNADVSAGGARGGRQLLAVMTGKDGKRCSARLAKPRSTCINQRGRSEWSPAVSAPRPSSRTAAVFAFVSRDNLLRPSALIHDSMRQYCPWSRSALVCGLPPCTRGLGSSTLQGQRRVFNGRILISC